MTKTEVPKLTRAAMFLEIFLVGIENSGMSDHKKLNARRLI